MLQFLQKNYHQEIYYTDHTADFILVSGSIPNVSKIFFKTKTRIIK
jgi:hypothetical protein